MREHGVRKGGVTGCRHEIGGDDLSFGCAALLPRVSDALLTGLESRSRNARRDRIEQMGLGFFNDIARQRRRNCACDIAAELRRDRADLRVLWVHCFTTFGAATRAMSLPTDLAPSRARAASMTCSHISDASNGLLTLRNFSFTTSASRPVCEEWPAG